MATSEEESTVARTSTRSDWSSTLVFEAIAKEREDRPPSADAFAVRISAILEPPSPVSASPPARRPALRRALVAAAALVPILFAIRQLSARDGHAGPPVPFRAVPESPPPIRRDTACPIPLSTRPSPDSMPPTTPPRLPGVTDVR